MLTLYDNPFSTNAQKVRLVMAEKDIDFESIILDLQAGDQFLLLTFRAQSPLLQLFYQLISLQFTHFIGGHNFFRATFLLIHFWNIRGRTSW